MLPEKKKKATAGILIGVLVMVLSGVIEEIEVSGFVEQGSYFLGLGIFAIGCAYFAQAKGYSNALGGVLGLFLIGLVVLLFLKDKHPEAE